MASGLLRLETTINQVQPFRSYRASEGNPDGGLEWRPMRRGVADLYRRAEVSQKAAERYADALASVDDSRCVKELTEDLERGTQWKGRPIRALRPFGKDNALLLAVSRGEFHLNGFRNRDARRLLYPNTTDPAMAQREAARTSRQLRRGRHRSERPSDESGTASFSVFREEALAELASVLEMIAAEYDEKGLSLPADSTSIVNA